MTAIKVRDLLSKRGDPLQLESLTGDAGLDRELPSPEASSPGLVLAGYTARFAGAADRMHILGETEITYLSSLDQAARRTAIETFLAYDLPCIVVTKGQQAPEELVTLAAAKGIAVIRTRLKTAEFYRRLKPFLDDAFAPTTTVHGSLADVFGVGLLFRGRSGIGKSECVLDLVERGHRLTEPLPQRVVVAALVADRDERSLHTRDERDGGDERLGHARMRHDHAAQRLTHSLPRGIPAAPAFRACGGSAGR